MKSVKLYYSIIYLIAKSYNVMNTRKVWSENFVSLFFKKL